VIILVKTLVQLDVQMPLVTTLGGRFGCLASDFVDVSLFVIPHLTIVHNLPLRFEQAKVQTLGYVTGPLICPVV
jgi:hypothetical protein